MFSSVAQAGRTSWAHPFIDDSCRNKGGVAWQRTAKAPRAQKVGFANGLSNTACNLLHTGDVVRGAQDYGSTSIKSVYFGESRNTRRKAWFVPLASLWREIGRIWNKCALNGILQSMLDRPYRPKLADRQVSRRDSLRYEDSSQIWLLLQALRAIAITIIAQNNVHGTNEWPRTSS